MTEVQTNPLMRSAMQRLVLVTGPAGAGRSSAIRTLEDLGYEAIDNLPISLIPRLLEGPAPGAPMAIGVDTRNREFSTGTFEDLIDDLALREDILNDVLYLDCRTEILLRRFSETRRRHPLAPSEGPGEGIVRDIEMLAPIRARADILIDTSDLSVHDLKAEVTRHFALEAGTRLGITLQSFSYKMGLPRALDFAFDCRFLRNPHWDAALRPLDGRDPAVHAYVAADANFGTYVAQVEAMLAMVAPASVAEGKSHLSVGFGCTGGQHRSVAMAQRIALSLAGDGWRVSIRHREIERRAAAGAQKKSEVAE